MNTHYTAEVAISFHGDNNKKLIDELIETITEFFDKNLGDNSEHEGICVTGVNLQNVRIMLPTEAAGRCALCNDVLDKAIEEMFI